jgi:Phosphotransferase enzyme family
MATNLAAKAAMASKFASLTGHVLVEKLLPRKPTQLKDVPASPDVLTTEWLTAALCSGHPGAEVSDFAVGVGSGGTTSRAPLTIGYNTAGKAVGLPVEVFAKATPRLTSRLVTVPIGALYTEAQFYNKIQPTLEIETPTGYYAVVDERSGRSMFLLEDIARTRNCTFADITKLYVDRDKAEDQIRLLATLHGSFWGSPRQQSDLACINTALKFQIVANNMIDFEGRSLIGLKRAADVIPRRLLGRGREIYGAAMRSLEAHAGEPMTLLHSDVHLNNWYVTGEGRMGLCDWQVASWGNWAMDVAYVMASALTVEDRRVWERELIEIYLEQLKASGGPADLDFSHAWQQYRQQVFHGLIFWLFTLGHGRLQPAMQPDPVSLVNLERMTNAIVDLDSLASI